MHSAGARALREDDNEMSREAVLLQWERKIEVAERLEDDSSDAAQPVPLRPEGEINRSRRFERTATEAEAEAETETEPTATQPAAHATERRTITITGQPAPARRRRAVVDSQLAQPDRIALWAFLLGLLLVAVAAGTAHA
jgi:thiol:disulfide interchange protein